MYAEPARAFIEARGGEVRADALARVIVDGTDACAAVDVRGRAHRDAPASSRPCPGSRCARLFASPVPPALGPTLVADAGAMESMPIVTVNLWYDRRVMDEPFVGLPGRDMQWVFDKRLAFGASASHLSLVSSGATRLTG